jgi:hypothetical protein
MRSRIRGEIRRTVIDRSDPPDAEIPVTMPELRLSNFIPDHVAKRKPNSKRALTRLVNAKR